MKRFVCDFTNPCPHDNYLSLCYIVCLLVKVVCLVDTVETGELTETSHVLFIFYYMYTCIIMYHYILLAVAIWRGVFLL